MIMDRMIVNKLNVGKLFGLVNGIVANRVGDVKGSEMRRGILKMI